MEDKVRVVVTSIHLQSFFFRFPLPLCRCLFYVDFVVVVVVIDSSVICKKKRKKELLRGALTNKFCFVSGAFSEEKNEDKLLLKIFFRQLSQKKLYNVFFVLSKLIIVTYFFIKLYFFCFLFLYGSPSLSKTLLENAST